MFDFDIKILPGAERVVFGGDVVIADDNGEVLDDFLVVKDANDLVLLIGGEQGFLVFAFLDLGAEVGGVYKNDIAFVGGIEEENGDVRAGGREDVAGHGDHTGEHLVFHEVLADAFFNAGLGSDETGGNDDGGFAFGAEGMDDVLDEEQIDGHLVLVLVRHIRNPGEESLVVSLGIEIVPELGEVEFERWIGDDEIEDAVQNRCHKMIRTSYRINKRIGSKKVNETYL